MFELGSFGTLVFTAGLFLFLVQIESILTAHSNLGWLHSNFISVLTLKEARALLSRGTTTAHGYDVDTLDRAINT